MSETAIISESPKTQENLKSFDVLSSLRLYQFDRSAFGYIRPETRQRVYDEELSYIAEGIDRPNYTEFTIPLRNGELSIFHQGRWEPYLSTLERGLKAAEREMALDYRKAFEAERRAADQKRGNEMMQLEPGQKIHWYYDFPKEQQARYGAKFLEGMGYQPARQLGYLCEAEKKPDGSVIIRQQSVESNDDAAFEIAMRSAEFNGSIDGMRAAYDQTLEQKQGLEYYAGRRLDQKASLENAWELVTGSRDLVGYYLDEIERLSGLDLPLEELESTKKRLTYGVWARLKERIDAATNGANYASEQAGYGGSIQSEIESAYASAAARYEVLFGCGGAIGGEAAIQQASSKGVFETIFGKKMNCPFCGATQYGDPCSSSQYCTACTAEVKNGKVISTGRAQIKKGFLELIFEEFSAWNQKYKSEQAQKKQRAAEKG